MKITSDLFIEKMKDGRKVMFGIDNNNMFFGEIRDESGEIECSILAESMAEVHKWIDEHEQEV